MQRRFALGFLLLAACSAAAARNGESSNDVNAATDAPTTIIDPSYGTKGAVEGRDEMEPTFAFSLGGRVVVGHVPSTNVLSFTSLLADGTPDLAMGKDGLAAVTIAKAAPDHLPVGARYAVEDDGTVLAYGSYTSDTTSSAQPFLARVVNGALDSTFGTAGIVEFDAPGTMFTALAVHHLTKGKVAGYYAIEWATNKAWLLHLDAAGALDATFGGTTDGRVTLPAASQLSVTVDGAGRPTVLDADHCQALRFTAAGVPDTTFGNVGAITTDMTGVTSCAGFTFSDDSMVVQVSTKDTTVLATVTADGLMATPITPASPATLVGVTSDHKLMAQRDGLERLNADGTLDSTFPLQPTLANVSAMSALSDGRMMIASLSAVRDGSANSQWTVQRIFPTPRSVTAPSPDDAGADATTADASTPEPVDAGADAATKKTQTTFPTNNEEVPSMKTGQSGSDSTESSTSKETADLPPAGGKMTQEPSLGCTTTGTGAGTREAPFLLLILAVGMLAMRRRT